VSLIATLFLLAATTAMPAALLAAHAAGEYDFRSEGRHGAYWRRRAEKYSSLAFLLGCLALAFAVAAGAAL
jgi:hypothetical protein